MQVVPHDMALHSHPQRCTCSDPTQQNELDPSLQKNIWMYRLALCHEALYKTSKGGQSLLKFSILPAAWWLPLESWYPRADVAVVCAPFNHSWLTDALLAITVPSVWLRYLRKWSPS